jgi:hypothetical protein
MPYRSAFKALTPALGGYTRCRRINARPNQISRMIPLKISGHSAVFIVMRHTVDVLELGVHVSLASILNSTFKCFCRYASVRESRCVVDVNCVFPLRCQSHSVSTKLPAPDRACVWLVRVSQTMHHPVEWDLHSLIRDCRSSIKEKNGWFLWFRCS